ncbi:MAG: lytic transglycosylase domain-containing protein [Endomicrobiales bacterium]|nr:lytic transglycosylase domain-containing protein [Endomicrobiales bacterium]
MNKENVKKYCVIGASLLVPALIYAVLSSGVTVRLIKDAYYAESVAKYSSLYGIDPLLTASIIRIESKFSRNARSERGAIGLMQILPATADEMAEELGLEAFNAERDLEDPDTNIMIGIYYYSKLKKDFGGNKILALAAYNAGKSKVASWHIQNPLLSFEVTDIPYKETRNYVKKIMGTYRWLKRLQAIKKKIT